MEVVKLEASLTSLGLTDVLGFVGKRVPQLYKILRDGQARMALQQSLERVRLSAGWDTKLIDASKPSCRVLKTLTTHFGTNRVAECLVRQAMLSEGNKSVERILGRHLIHGHVPSTNIFGTAALDADKRGRETLPTCITCNLLNSRVDANSVPLPMIDPHGRAPSCQCVVEGKDLIISLNAQAVYWLVGCNVGKIARFSEAILKCLDAPSSENVLIFKELHEETGRISKAGPGDIYIRLRAADRTPASHNGHAARPSDTITVNADSVLCHNGHIELAKILCEQWWSASSCEARGVTVSARELVGVAFKTTDDLDSRKCVSCGRKLRGTKIRALPIVDSRTGEIKEEVPMIELLQSREVAYEEWGMMSTHKPG